MKLKILIGSLAGLVIVPLIVSAISTVKIKNNSSNLLREVVNNKTLGARTASLDASSDITIGSITIPTFTNCSVLFAGSGGLLSQDNTNLCFLDSTNRLGIGTSTPSETVSVVGAGGTNPFAITSSSGSNLFKVLQNGDITMGAATDGALINWVNSVGGVEIYGQGSGGFNVQTDSDLFLRLDADGTQNGAFQVLNSGNTPLLTVAEDPYVAFGTTTAGSYMTIQASASANPIINIASSTGTSVFKVMADGKIGIGTSTPTHLLSAQATAEGNMVAFKDTDGLCLLDPDSASLVTTCSSDARLKSNIKPAQAALPDLLRLPVSEYTINASGNFVPFGPVAQKIKEVEPALVSESEGVLMVQEVSTWRLLKAIQELNERIVDLEKLIN